jgi:hypothetical protein
MLIEERCCEDSKGSTLRASRVMSAGMLPGEGEEGEDDDGNDDDDDGD